MGTQPGRGGSAAPRNRLPSLSILTALAAQALFAWLVLSGLDAPLLWHDEADTAMFGRRILEYGYPKVHASGNVLYGVQHPVAIGVEPRLDAYLGSPWGQYYFAAAAVAWSDGAGDLGSRTRRVRLPFALAGLIGIALLAGVGARCWPLSGGTGPWWLGLALCAVLSVSLQLHLREARYYPLVVLGLGAIAWLESRRHREGTRIADALALWLAASLWWLFNVFYPAFGVVALSALFIALWAAWRSELPWRARARRAAADLAPYAAAGFAALPLLFFYRIPAQSQAFQATFGGEGVWRARLVDACVYLIRFEFLAPVLVGALALALARRRVAGETPSWARACDIGLLFVGLWVLLVAWTPFFYERYFVALSPLLSGLCLLQVGGLLSLRRGAAHRVASVGLVAVGAAFLASAAVRGPELAGRFAELREPYRGPLDHVIPYLAQRHPDPAKLVIATNYEGPSYMFYLGATATLGFYAPDPAADLAKTPDVIIPRPWGVNRRALRWLVAQAPHRRLELPVGNTRANNVPSLSRRNQARLVHRFRAPSPDGEFGALLVFEREEL